MRAHLWPGNIRELRNVIERALVLCESGEITTEHLPVEKMRLAHLEPALVPSSLPATGSAGPRTVPGIVLTPAESAERDRIVRVLAEFAGSQTQAAKTLGVSRGTLIERLKRYDIQRPRIKPRT